MEHPVYIDFEKATDSQKQEYTNQASKLVSACMSAIANDPNPIKAVSRLFNRLGGLALTIFPQSHSTFAHPRKPGWNKYVRAAQTQLELAITLWHMAGCNPHGPLALDVAKARLKRKAALDEME